MELAFSHTTAALTAQADRVRPLDLAFGEWVAGLESQHQDIMAAIATWVSFSSGQQHVCLSLEALVALLGTGESGEGIVTTEGLRTLLLQAQSVCNAQTLAPQTQPSQPLVLDQYNLYLQRYWVYETRLAAQIRSMVNRPDFAFGAEEEACLSTVFDNNTADTDWQKIAVVIAAIKPLALITGGPGTGKTTTVARLLALLQSANLAKTGCPLEIKLAAPTGKAAARLSESLQRAKAKLPAEMSQGLPEQCLTIHRLLGPRSNSPYFKHNARHPLRLDLLVLDEASMVDLPLMSKLVDAMPPHGRLVMLGDQDQLASVEVGSVLGDLCQAAVADTFGNSETQLLNRVANARLSDSNHAGGALQNNRVTLVESHRFDDSGGIGRLAKAVNGQRAKEVTALLSEGAEGLQWYPNGQLDQLITLMQPELRRYYRAIQSGELTEAFASLNRQQVLCALRSGPLGVAAVNHAVEKFLVKSGNIPPGQLLYAGRPIIVTQNEPRLKLFNGDIGLLMMDSQGILKVWFTGADGKAFNVLPSRLPQHETVYAMTIHKSQGSEFDRVFLCLPPQGSESLLSTEILYTGLTRAKREFSLFATERSLLTCLSKRCLRGSGLGERLGHGHHGP